MEPHVVEDAGGPLEVCGGALEVHLVPLGRDNLGWVLVCAQTGECAFVDGPEAGPMLALAEGRGWTPRAVLNTHTHGDHVGLNRELARRGLLGGLRIHGRERGRGSVPGLTHAVGEGDPVRVGRVVGRVLLTEGHLDGHVSFLFGDALFCGDSLFTGGCGRLFDGPAAKMHDTLRRFAALPPPTRVFCGHEYTEDNLRFAAWLEPESGAVAARLRDVRAVRATGRSAVPSSIADELATNPFMRAGSASLRRAVSRHVAVAPDAPAVEVFAATRALKDRGPHRARVR